MKHQPEAPSDAGAAFAENRGRLWGIAYRMDQNIDFPEVFSDSFSDICDGKSRYIFVTFIVQNILRHILHGIIGSIQSIDLFKLH